jgi:hypothetical protein
MNLEDDGAFSPTAGGLPLARLVGNSHDLSSVCQDMSDKGIANKTRDHEDALCSLRGSSLIRVMCRRGVSVVENTGLEHFWRPSALAPRAWIRVAFKSCSRHGNWTSQEAEDMDMKLKLKDRLLVNRSQ